MMSRFLVVIPTHIDTSTMIPASVSSVFRVNKCYGKNLKDTKTASFGPSIFKSKGMGDLFHSVHKEKQQFHKH